MKIEVAKEGRMDMSGQGLLRAIQNDNMPLLDLFVRESVQNSLDACQPKEEPVQVEFGTGIFNSQELATQLDGISLSLEKKYGSDNCSFIFVRDSNTEGLTGPMHFSEEDYGNRNLLKLVYEIAKPQDNKGAGGSWGYGKTIYFRIGIGLVIYYSRIKNEDGRYQSRLAACLVEDEKREDSLLCNPMLGSKRGLAWWGDYYEYNAGSVSEIGTVPITNEEEIRLFLELFNLRPYDLNETGTTIIIPYIDEERLLRNNIVEDSQIPWTSNIGNYLRIAVQRWYIGRLNNPNYTKIHKQPWLQVSVDGERIGRDDMPEPFAIIQNLYNMALKGEERDDDYHCKPIVVRKYFRSTTSGFIAYKMCSSEELGTLPPINNPSPFMYCKNEEGSDDYKDGDIILAYFRKPGMAVTYDTAGEWVNKIKCNNEKTGDVLLAVYVLNSKNKFCGDKASDLETIEDYFRASERADHTSWYDINVGDTNPRILSKIQAGIRKKINETYIEEQGNTEIESSSLSKMFGEFFLPPQGFGRKAGRPSKNGKSREVFTKNKGVSAIVRSKEFVIDDDMLVMPVEIRAERPVNKLVFSFEIAADGKNIPLYQWTEKTGIELPFWLERATIKTIQAEKRIVERDIELSKSFTNEMIDVERIITDDDKGYGITISSEYKELLINMELAIRINDYASEMKYQIREGE